ncbi:MAG: hypothetical protein U9R42_04230 [Bacteroidota bacterium]|nr:hypothetical protein [Bacteroidota bacterium]
MILLPLFFISNCSSICNRLSFFLKAKYYLFILLLFLSFFANSQQWLPSSATSIDQIQRTGDFEIGNLSNSYSTSNYFDILHNPTDDNDWNQFIFNGRGYAKILRLKGGFNGNNRALFQIETNSESSDLFAEDNFVFRVLGNGAVIIGNEYIHHPTQYWDAKLMVNGVIASQKIVVRDQTNWSDFVFDKDYKLPSLFDVEKFISLNKHLPGVPSASEVKENGLDLGEMDAVLLKKIEELTLYLIELKKENKEIKKQLDEIKLKIK